MDFLTLMQLVGFAILMLLIGSFIGYDVLKRRYARTDGEYTMYLHSTYKEQAEHLRKVIRDHEQTIEANSELYQRDVAVLEQQTKYWKEQHGEVGFTLTRTEQACKALRVQLHELQSDMQDVDSAHNKRMITRGKRAMGKKLRAEHAKRIEGLERVSEYYMGLAERANQRSHVYVVSTSQAIEQCIKLKPVADKFRKTLAEIYDSNLKQVKMK